MKYREKRIVVEAVKWDGNLISEVPEWISTALKLSPNTPGAIMRMASVIHIFTKNGILIAYPDDYIVRNLGGEIYPVPSSFFESTYEKAE